MNSEEKTIITIHANVVDDIKQIINNGRATAYASVNSTMIATYWNIGRRIVEEEQHGKERAEYGKRVIASLAQNLTAKYGKGFNRKDIYNYLKFYRMFPEIVDTVRRQSEKVDAASRQLLPWTHYRELIRVENPEARKWYEQEALREVWSTRTLHRNIASQYYFRLLQSAHKEKVVDELKKGNYKDYLIKVLEEKHELY